MTKQTVSWPGWEVVRPIGSGSFGTVYEIRRELLGRDERAALKVLSIPREQSEVQELIREGYDANSITAHFRRYLDDIVREYSLMMDMKGHTNIVCCDDLRYSRQESGIGWNIYIKMELLTPLNQALDRSYNERAVIRLGMDLCSALALCRQQNILHRDIKPANIFVSKNGDYKLGDFGVAKTAEKTSGGTKIGTYEYMAPEVYNCQPYGPASDLYAVGLVMYWMMNNWRRPFLPEPSRIPTADEKELARQRRFRGEPLPPPANGSPMLKQIVLHACEFYPGHRFADPLQMRQALSDLLARMTPPPTHAAPNYPPVYGNPQAYPRQPQPPRPPVYQQPPVYRQNPVRQAPPPVNPIPPTAPVVRQSPPPLDPNGYWKKAGDL